MLDIKYIRENQDQVKKAAKNKNIELDLDKLLKTDDQRRKLIQEIEELRMEKNKYSKNFPQLEDKEKEKIMKKMKKVGEKQNKLDKELKEIKKDYNNLIYEVPMVPSEKTPVGKDDNANVEIKKWGEITKFDFKLKDHIRLGRDLDIIDNERAVKIGGSRSYILKGDGARLESALLKYAQDFISGKNYTLLSVPVVVEEFAMRGTGFLPGAEEDLYYLPKDKKYLAGTSEVALASYHANELLEKETLPKKYSAFSSCFRREAGTYGKDTHGLYRVHQFFKVEQVIVCEGKAAVSEKMFYELLANVEEFLQSLELPYRVLNICTGDMGQGKYYMNDIECWMPSRNSYGETHSCSNLHDFQTRRLNIRYKTKEGKTKFCHTLNNTLVATPRILIPLLELNQTKEGEIKIPAVLKPYMNNQKKIELKK